MANSSISSNKGLGKMASSRLQKEMKELQGYPLLGIALKDGEDLKRWVVELTVPPGGVYANKTYLLQITFPYEYPILPPQVMFLNPVPVHPSVRSCGLACVDGLARDWTPAITVRALCLSILAMLSGTTLPKEAGNQIRSRL